MSIKARLASFAVAMALIQGWSAPAHAQQPPSIEDFLAPPHLNDASLSPSGRYLVMSRRNGDQSDILVKDLETGVVTAPIGGAAAREHFGGTYIDWIAWKGDDRLVIGVTQFQIDRHNNRTDGEIRSFRFGHSLISVGRDGSGSRLLESPRATRGNPGDLLSLLTHDDEHLLLTYSDGGGGLDVARINVLTGESERIVDGDVRVMGYIVDNAGAVVGRTVLRGMTGRILVMEARGEDGRWTEVFRMRQDEIRQLPDYRVLGTTDQPGRLYVAINPRDEAGPTTAGVHIFDFSTRSMGPEIWRNPDYDVSGIVRDQRTGAFLAGCYWSDTYQCDFGDPTLGAVMRGVRNFFGAGWSVEVVSQADDNSRWLLRASSAVNPGEYYLYDYAARKLEAVGPQFPRTPEASMGPMARVDYAAGDGQALFGYLTRPPGAAADARPPLIVMPHGGPESRDTLSYDPWVQFFATRGYQVFQPNFRGSSGMGRAFAEAGYRQWGGMMQDDVTAGVEHLIAQGVVDRDRICIIGASYGGYAALWGGATQPDLYRCVIAIAGVSDLLEIQRWERVESGGDSDRYEYWEKSIGNPERDRAALQAVSPIRRVADWRPPLLLIHGENDGIVPIDQSRDMERAMRRAGKDVKLVEIEETGHNFSSPTAGRILLTEMEAFLARHLPVAAPAPPAPASP